MLRGVEQLTRSRDGTSGVAYFTFENPSMFESKATAQETIQEAITSMRMVDSEGDLATTDVSAKFVNGLPVTLTVLHVMKSAEEWERFLRFMDRYAASNDLGFAGQDAADAAAGAAAGAAKPRSQGV